MQAVLNKLLHNEGSKSFQHCDAPLQGSVHVNVTQMLWGFATCLYSVLRYCVASIARLKSVSYSRAVHDPINEISQYRTIFETRYK